MNKLRVVLVKPGQEPIETEIDDSLAGMQAAVGGYIETVSLLGGAVLVCNEEGKLQGLQANRRLGHDVICGDFFVTASNDEGDFVSLSDEQVASAKELFAL